jgi:methyltransferase-like protein
MFASNYGSLAESHLEGLASNLIDGEQHLDLLRNRGFRQTLICHADIPLTRQISLPRDGDLYFFGRVAPQNPQIDLRDRGPETFVAASGLTLSTSAPALKIALHHLNKEWPRAFTLDQLLSHAAELAAVWDRALPIPQQARDALGQNLLKCVANGLLEITTLPDGFVTTLSERPIASRLARLEARQAGRVTNRRHELIDIDDSIRNVLPYLDGQRDRQALIRELIEAVNRGDISILVGGLPAKQGEAVVKILEETLDQSLQKLAQHALLVG